MDLTHHPLQRSLGARHSCGISGINTDTEPLKSVATPVHLTTALEKTFSQCCLVEGLRETGYDDKAPAGNLVESGINFGH